MCKLCTTFECTKQVLLTTLFLSLISGDSFTYHSQSYFSTKDRDNDAWNGEDCAQRWTGAWWYKHCHHSNLNGVYGSSEEAKGVHWLHWKGHKISLTGTRMMVKPKP